MGGFFDALGKIGGSIGSILGPVGAGISIYQSLKAGKQAKQGQDAAVGQQNQFLGYDKTLLDSMMPAYTNALGSAAAPAYDFASPYNDAATDMAFHPYQEGIATDANNSVAALAHDMASRGIRGGTGFDNGAGMIRRGQAHDTAAIRANMRYQGGISRYNEAKAAEDARFQRLSAMLAPMSGILTGGANNAGSLVQTYANQATNAGNSLAGGLSAIGSLAPMGANAGNNRTQTNQVATGAGNTMPRYPMGPTTNPVPMPPQDPYNRPVYSGTGLYS